MFKDQIEASIEVYVDDMLVKSKKEDDHLAHLKQAFEVMRGYEMKLNPTKCTFGFRSGIFLGYMVSEREIEANPEKIEAIMRLQSPEDAERREASIDTSLKSFYYDRTSVYPTR
ncbi:UNVERIFIED_CONTAM: Transposon Tf2-12 polyprotein [Sesamum calycinum]|uniref:Transposon Tf2-12 polyprotein n=1 Tax=Sesamum calycinum TaxID=2727403 RepID=A0AAW2PBL1_9LAMI